VREARNVVENLRTKIGDEVVEKCVSIRVIAGEELLEGGFGGIYGVGKAAIDPPALVALVYQPESGYGKTVAWVGKGIVYDTGGLSLKTSQFMPGMKRDMGGSAAILHGWSAAVQNHHLLDGQSSSSSSQVGVRLIAILCLAENAIGPIATRPDDIHLMYSGKTVEINNTDAEGRLVLADGVAFATKEYHPDILLDMCTLTGAQGVATGKLHAAIVCNNDDLERAAVDAGRRSGDLTFPLLYCPELFRQEFVSSVADLKNSVADRSNAASSCAAQFIAEHLGDFSGKWLHVDMAYPVHAGERATGYGVALLNDLFVFNPFI